MAPRRDSHNQNSGLCDPVRTRCMSYPALEWNTRLAGSSAHIEAQKMGINLHHKRTSGKLNLNGTDECQQKRNVLKRSVSLPLCQHLAPTDLRHHPKQNTSDTSIITLPQVVCGDKNTFFFLPAESIFHDPLPADVTDDSPPTIDSPIGSMTGENSLVEGETGRNGTVSFTQYVDDEDWNSVVVLCEDYPSMAQQEIIMVHRGEKTKCLPLHLVCKRNPVLPAIDSLFTAYPDSVLQPDSHSGQLPIHIAILANASSAVVQYLVDSHPCCVKTKDMDGNIPLHVAAMHGSDDVISIVLNAYTEGCQVTNHRGKSPLGLICSRWHHDDNDTQHTPPSIASICDIFSAYPEGAITKDSRGALPIHGASNMHNPRPDVLELLLKAYPSTVLMRDENGYTPLQLAKICQGHQGKRNGHTAIKLLQSYTIQEQKKMGLTQQLVRKMEVVKIIGRLNRTRRKFHPNAHKKMLTDDNHWMAEDRKQCMSPITRKW